MDFDFSPPLRLVPDDHVDTSEEYQRKQCARGNHDWNPDVWGFVCGFEAPKIDWGGEEIAPVDYLDLTPHLVDMTAVTPEQALDYLQQRKKIGPPYCTWHKQCEFCRVVTVTPYDYSIAKGPQEIPEHPHIWTEWKNHHGYDGCCSHTCELCNKTEREPHSYVLVQQPGELELQRCARCGEETVAPIDLTEMMKKAEAMQDYWSRENASITIDEILKQKYLPSIQQQLNQPFILSTLNQQAGSTNQQNLATGCTAIPSGTAGAPPYASQQQQNSISWPNVDPAALTASQEELAKWLQRYPGLMDPAKDEKP